MVDQTEGHLHLALLAERLPRTEFLAKVPGFKQQHPQIQISLSFESCAAIEEGLTSDRLSFGIVEREVANELIESRTLGTVESIAVASPAYLATRGSFERKESVLLGDLIDLDLGLPLLASWLGAGDATMLAMLQQARPSVVVPDVDAAYQLVCAGAGISFLPKSLVERDLETGALVLVCPDHAMPSRPLEILYRSRTARQLAESLLLEYLLESYGADGYGQLKD